MGVKKKSARMICDPAHVLARASQSGQRYRVSDRVSTPEGADVDTRAQPCSDKIHYCFTLRTLIPSALFKTLKQ